MDEVSGELSSAHFRQPPPFWQFWEDRSGQVTDPDKHAKPRDNFRRRDHRTCCSL
jgi:hypothetical protein